jgi:hypothetical protein
VAQADCAETSTCSPTADGDSGPSLARADGSAEGPKKGPKKGPEESAGETDSVSGTATKGEGTASAPVREGAEKADAGGFVDEETTASLPACLRQWQWTEALRIPMLPTG